LNGAPYTTFDLDIVHARDPENIERLLAVLKSLQAVYRFPRERRLEPDASHLSGPGHLLLTTRFGYLDVLGTVGSREGYAELLPHAIEMDVGEGVRTLTLNLETVIRLKEQANRDKDRIALPVLRQTLNEKNR